MAGRGGDMGRQERGPEVASLGGCCSYTPYDGVARITRIVKTDASREQASIVGGPGYEGYEIWFRFIPNEGDDIKERESGIFQREHILTLRNSWYPGPRFLEKYSLMVGNDYPCTLNIIKTGACAPVVFDFQTIDTTNYFETKK
jgi:hypothetical protein